jgi:hypothetical protein
LFVVLLVSFAGSCSFSGCLHVVLSTASEKCSSCAAGVCANTIKGMVVVAVSFLSPCFSFFLFDRIYMQPTSKKLVPPSYSVHAIESESGESISEVALKVKVRGEKKKKKKRKKGV